MVRKLILLFVLICAISPLLATVTENNYCTDRIIIKLKSPQYSVVSLGLEPTLQEMPESIRKLSDANGAKELNPVGATKRQINTSGFSSLSAARAYNTKLQQLDEKYGTNRIYEIVFDSDKDIPFLVEQYKNDATLEYAQPVFIYKTMSNDPLTPNQTNLAKISAEGGWSICTGSPTIIIAIIDTGIASPNHEDMGGGKVLPGWNFINGTNNTADDNGHGTRVSGIAAANGNNGLGVCGIDWNAKILPLKVLSATGTGNTVDIYNAVAYAESYGVEVINLSLGSTGNDPTLETKCASAYAAGIILVAAMGNVGSGVVQNSVVYPAAYSSVIGVGSVDANDNLSSFSVYGSGDKTTELVAPGEYIYTTCLDGRKYASGSFGESSGTSFASPQVAGLCALMKAKYPTMTNEQIRLALHNTADDLGASGYDIYFGYGKINMQNALSMTASQKAKKNETLTDLFNFPNPATTGKTKFSFKTNKGVTKVSIKVYDLKGKLAANIESGVGIAGTYITNPWDCLDDDGNKLPNGTYLYIVEATFDDNEIAVGKGKMAIIN